MEKFAPGFTELRTYLPDELAAYGELRPLRSGRIKAEPGFQMGPRILDYYGLHFVMKGLIRFVYGEREITLTGGDAFCVFPGIIYRQYHVPSEHLLEMNWISIDGQQASTLVKMAGFSEDVPYIQALFGKELETTLRQLYISPIEYSSRRQVELYAIIYRLFSLMIPEQVAPQHGVGPTVWIQQSIDFMNTHYTENISVQDVATYVSLHRVYFSKVFAEHTGTTPIQYLQKLRMERALRLLQQTSHTVTEVAMTVGFPDLYSFSRAFSKYYGLPPSKLR